MNTSSSSSCSMWMLLAALTITTLLLLNLPLTTADPGSLESDKKALWAFYSTLESPQIKLINWRSEEDVCKWIGITCKDKQQQGGIVKSDFRVAEVGLPGKSIYGRIAAKSIGRLDALEKLILRENGLYGNLPSDILSSPTLQVINLQKNSFCGDLPDFKDPTGKLKRVDFSFNNFSGTIPSEFNNSKNLVYLDLQSNLFSGKIPDFDLKLKELYLGKNSLAGPIPPSFQKFGKDSFEENPDLCGKPLESCEQSPAPAYSNKLGDVAHVASSLLLFLLLL